MQPVEVVVAADVVVAALSRTSAAALRFPAMPPKTTDPHVDAVGAFVAAEGDFALILTDEIVEQVVTTLTDARGLAWAFDMADEAVEVLAGIAAHSRGGFVAPAFETELPAVTEAAAAALRAAASKDLGFPRVVVTGDRDALAWRRWRPTGVPWPPDEDVSVQGPARFRDLIHDARWRFRRA